MAIMIGKESIILFQRNKYVLVRRYTIRQRQEKRPCTTFYMFSLTLFTAS